MVPGPRPIIMTSLEVTTQAVVTNQAQVTRNTSTTLGPGHLPSTVTLSTDSCRLLPRRTTLTVCHSLSLSLCPANSVSGPLPAAPRGE